MTHLLTHCYLNYHSNETEIFPKRPSKRSWNARTEFVAFLEPLKHGRKHIAKDSMRLAFSISPSSEPERTPRQSAGSRSCKILPCFNSAPSPIMQPVFKTLHEVSTPIILRNPTPWRRCNQPGDSDCSQNDPQWIFDQA